MQITNGLSETSFSSEIYENRNKKNITLQAPTSTNKASKMPTDSQIISYYKNLCKDFQNITFKMSDYETGKKNSSLYIGYKGNSYQQGNNFSSPGQCSIQIDVAVIRNMMTNPEYELQVRGRIQNIVSFDYSQFEQWAQHDGCEYCYVGLMDENGKLTECIGFAESRIPTDEELRELWANKTITPNRTKEVKIDYEKLINNVKNEMQETFFSMFDEAQHRKNKIV